MREIVQGTFTGNAARLLGKLAPSGIVSGALSAGLGHVIGHTVGVPVLGLAAKAVGDAMTRSKAARLSEAIRLRSALARQIGASAYSRNPNPALAKALQAGRLGNQYGE